MGCSDRHLEGITRLQHAGRLAFNRKFQAALKNEAGFDPWMGVSGDERPLSYGRFHDQRRVPRRWTVHLGQDLSGETGGRRRRGILRQYIGRNEPCSGANGAGGKPREAASCQHDYLPRFVQVATSRQKDVWNFMIAKASGEVARGAQGRCEGRFCRDSLSREAPHPG
jgi:hypothetical protein